VQNSSGIKIGRKDVIWNYLATFLQIGSGILLFPIILRLLPSETVGVWSIFMAIGSLIGLLDFGFSPSFTRNITYIFSGVNSLEKTGISNGYIDNEININLLSNTIRAMRWFYSRVAFIAFILLITVGSAYLFSILNSNFNGNKAQVTTAWIIFCIVNTYNIYTLYYDALMIGRGLIKKDKQLIIISQLMYLSVSIVLIFCGFGLISIVVGQALAVIIKRILSNRFFFTPELKKEIKEVNTDNFRDILKIITPNSIKVGFTSLGAFLVLQSSVIIGSLYISLNELASYGITVQVINVIATLASVYYSSYMPKVAQLRVGDNITAIKQIYIKSIMIMMLTFVASGIMLIIFGGWALHLLKSQTTILSENMIITLLIINLLEKNHAIAGGFLLSKNEVPYFKAAIISGIATVILLFTLLKYEQMGLWGMILAPGIVQISYQNWKWPSVLIRQLNSAK
jgi:O-antigen/teichoic acid export membrane protein